MNSFASPNQFSWLQPKVQECRVRFEEKKKEKKKEKRRKDEEGVKLTSDWLSLVVKFEGNHPLVDPTLPSHQPDSRHWKTVITSPFLKLNPC
jgi:hypothetical protein